MSGRVRAEISKSNPYWIPKHRLYELKHFCLQYPEWQKAYNALLGVSGRAFSTDPIKKSIRFSSPTERTGMLRAYYSRNMELVRTAAERATIFSKLGLICRVAKILTMMRIGDFSGY